MVFNMNETPTENDLSDTPVKRPASFPLLQQIKRHSVALISLGVAIIGLSYNTWRNESSEYHRNLREAGFQVLIELGELQQIVDYTVYFQARDSQQSQLDSGFLWTGGWGKAAMVRDLTSLMPGPAATQGKALFDHWQIHANALQQGIDNDNGKQAEQTLTQAVQNTREAVLTVLDSLR